MTEQQKDTLIAKMLENPTALTAAELDAIMADEEMRDIYQMSVDVAGACSAATDVDVEKEWSQFSSLLHRKPSRWAWVPRVAAIFLGVMVLSGITKVAIDYIFSPQPSKTLAKVQDTPSEPVLPILDIIDHEPQIAKATPVGITPQPISNRHAEIPAEEVDIEEYLRIDQARIDNELALLAAADIEADYQGMLEYLSEEGEALPDDWEITIVNLTME